MASQTIKQDRLIVAIDFGTTYSGIAFAYGPETANADRITVITSWPGAGGSSSEKVPSEVVYDSHGRLVKWGFEVGTRDPALRYVKLLLDPHKQFTNLADKATLQQRLKAVGKTTTDVVADYLSELLEWAKQALVKRYTKAFVESTPIYYVLTAPAVWSEVAKRATREAAEKAGIASHSLKVVAEPEAAAVYALSTTHGLTVEVGDVFTICDSGGGTVDAVTLQVLQKDPLSFGDFVVGDGRLCGGAFVNLHFERLLEERLGRDLTQMIRKTKPKTWEWALGDFEHKVKRAFDPSDDPEYIVLHDISLPGVADDSSRGIEDGIMTFSCRELRSFFDPLISRIVDLIESQRDQAVAAGKPAKAIILAGGFNQSPYVFKSVRDHFAHTNPVGQPGQGRSAPLHVVESANMWSSVVRGAVLRGRHGDPQIRSHRVRAHYGFLIDPYFEEGKHSRDSKRRDRADGTWRAKDQMEWLIHRGQEIRSGEPVLGEYFRNTSKIPSFFFETLYVSYDEIAPAAWTKKLQVQGSVRPLCTLRIPCDTDTLGRDAWESESVARKDFFTLTYDLGVYADSGSIHFDIRIDGKIRATVEAEFERAAFSV